MTLAVENTNNSVAVRGTTEPQRILIVDDESRLLNSLVKVISANNAQALLHTASSAEEALVILENNEVDLLITDLKLPQMDGLALTKETHLRYPELRSILMTAYGTEDVEALAYRNGCIAYFEKPFDIDSFLSSIEESLRPQPMPSGCSGKDLANIVEVYERQRRDVTLTVSHKLSLGTLVISDGAIRAAEFDELFGSAALVALLACKWLNISISPTTQLVDGDLFVSAATLRSALEARTVAEQFRLLRNPLRSPQVNTFASSAFVAEDFSPLPEIARETLSSEQAMPESAAPLDSEALRNKRLRVYVISGVEAFKRQNFARARRYWLSALQVDPSCQEARHNLAVVDQVLQNGRRC